MSNNFIPNTSTGGRCCTKVLFMDVMQVVQVTEQLWQNHEDEDEDEDEGDHTKSTSK